MARVKKGVLFTLASFILVSLILVLGFLVAYNIDRSDERVKEAASFDNINNVLSSIQKISMEIFDSFSPINVTITGSKVVFEERPPNDFTLFNNEMSALESFASGNPLVDLVYSEVDDSSYIIQIEPYGLKYMHGGGDILMQGYVSDYLVILKQSCITCPVPTITWVPPVFGTTRLEVEVRDANDNLIANDFNDIAVNKYNELSVVNLDNGGKVTISVNNSLMKISPSVDDNSVSFRSEVIMNFVENQKLEAIYPDSSLKANFSEFGIAAVKTLRLV